MKIVHVVGTRPNFVKVAPVRAALARCGGVNQIMVHTGQHYDAFMSDVFFRQLEIPEPDYNLGVGSTSHARQTAEIMIGLEPIIQKNEPDLVLVYGDVNSAVAAALVCSKLVVPIGHVEAGLRSFDRSMPEEINRILTDRIADSLFTHSLDGDKNLLGEGIRSEQIYFVGNVMIDTLMRLLPHVGKPALLERLSLTKSAFALVTLHRPSNVDDPVELRKILVTINSIADKIDMIFPIHPRTNKTMRELPNPCSSPRLHLVESVSYLEFLGLQRQAAFVITDSGGVQEETTFLGVPCLTVRENTERPVTVDMGTNILVGRDMECLVTEVNRILIGSSKTGAIPPLWDGKASERIADIILSKYSYV